MKRQRSIKYWHKTVLIGSKGVPQTFFFAQMGSADIFHHQKGSAHRKRLGNTAIKDVTFTIIFFFVKRIPHREKGWEKLDYVSLG